jgi:hypothetical protein
MDPLSRYDAIIDLDKSLPFREYLVYDTETFSWLWKRALPEAQLYSDLRKKLGW